MFSTRGKIMKLRVLLAIFMGLIIGFTAQAGVNLKNGNFYISYKDIEVPGTPHSLDITRTYNSKASRVGWFGFGWGSEYETFLRVSADGSVTIYENGSGAVTRFVTSKPIDVDAASKRIVDVLKSKSSISEDASKKLIENFKTDAELRQTYSTKLGIKTDISEGTKLTTTTRGLQELLRTKDGFKRTYLDGRTEFFSEDGRLVKMVDKLGYTMDFNYKDNRLVSIKDSEAKQLFFEWYPEGLMKSAWSVGDKKVSYKYQGKDLVESTDIENNIYKYAYDPSHNLTSVSYTNGTKMNITYDAKTKFVSGIVSPGGEKIQYDYGSDPKNPSLHYWTFVTRTGLDGKPVKNKYEYEVKVTADGAHYTARIGTVVEGVSTETIYNENSYPLKITRGGKEETTFTYTADGLLAKKNSSNGEFSTLEYHPVFKKISKVTNNQGWTKFDYDEKGNLSKATNDKNKKVLLVYDRAGRIIKMVNDDSKSKDGGILSFAYNSMGKPVEIVMENVGKINVSYDNYGEIKKVDSKEGPKMAMRVTQAFQQLLSIVGPAGVNLGL
jgi:YD repeat-containing protein